MDKAINVKNFIFDTLKVVIYALITSMLLSLIFAIIVKLASLNDTVVGIVNQVIKVVSILVGCLLGIKTCKLGAVKGAIAGILFVLFSFLIYSGINKQLSFSAMNIYDMLIGLASGLFSGILTVNLKCVKSEC